MRIATALVFTALIYAAQAQIFSGITSGFAQSARVRIEKLRNAIDEQLEQAKEVLQSGYKQARERVEDAYKSLEDAAEGIRERVKEAVDNVQESIRSQVSQMVENAEAEGADLSKCTSLVQSFRNASDVVVSDTASCVTEKVKKGKEIVTNILIIGQDSLDVITGIRSQSNQCVKNVESISEQIFAASCLVSVKAKANWALTTKVPAIAKDFTEATVLIYTLQPSLTYCISKNSILALAEHGNTVVADMRKCIVDRISTAQRTNKPEVPEDPATIPEVPKVPTTTSGLELSEFEEVLQKQA